VHCTRWLRHRVGQECTLASFDPGRAAHIPRIEADDIHACPECPETGVLTKVGVPPGEQHHVHLVRRPHTRAIRLLTDEPTDGPDLARRSSGARRREDGAAVVGNEAIDPPSIQESPQTGRPNRGDRSHVAVPPKRGEEWHRQDPVTDSVESCDCHSHRPPEVTRKVRDRLAPDGLALPCRRYSIPCESQEFPRQGCRFSTAPGCSRSDHVRPSSAAAGSGAARFQPVSE